MKYSKKAGKPNKSSCFPVFLNNQLVFLSYLPPIFYLHLPERQRLPCSSLNKRIPRISFIKLFLGRGGGPHGRGGGQHGVGGGGGGPHGLGGGGGGPHGLGGGGGPHGLGGGGGPHGLGGGGGPHGRLGPAS